MSMMFYWIMLLREAERDSSILRKISVPLVSFNIRAVVSNRM